jgi:hypothetical protein
MNMTNYPTSVQIFDPLIAYFFSLDLINVAALPSKVSHA